MQRPLLLIVDGESLRARGLDRALVADGWDLNWTTSMQMLFAQPEGDEPSVLLVDPLSGGDSGIQSALAYRNMHPNTRVVIIQDGTRGFGSVQLPEDTGVLPRNLPEEQWPSFLRGFLAMVQPDEKLSAEDLFGDILAEIDRPPPAPAVPQRPEPPPRTVAETLPPQPTPAAPPPQRISSPAPAAPSPAKPVVVQMPLSRPVVSQGSSKPKPTSPSTTTIQTPLLRAPVIRTSTVSTPKPVAPHAPIAPTVPSRVPPPQQPPRAQAPPVSIPQPPRQPEPLPPTMPMQPAEPIEDLLSPEFPELEPEELNPASEAPSPLLPELFGDLLGPLSESRARPAQGFGSDFTLSGFSGIHDPFEASGKEEAKPEDSPQSSQSLNIEFLTTSETTPARRGVNQHPGSPMQQPSAQPPAAKDQELRLENGESPLEEFGNYYLLEKIAVGGMAELFKARQRGVHNFEKIVAIKRILPHLSDNDEFVRMFIDEAKLAAQLTHPNIVQIFDLGKASGFYYIAMEYVDGKDLRSLLRKVREYRLPMPEPVAAYVTMKVAMALDYAHRKRGMNDKELKLVHRDVSPQNVLISSEGAVKLVDFGIAKAATKSTQTMAGALKGKLLYMSPEQALGQSLDNRSDIYSLGLVLFELLTGERCFQADSELGVLEKVRLGKVQEIQVVNPAVSQDLTEILHKALHKNVDLRYNSARLMERDLKSLLVRHGNEPTDHDVAEYVNTLLKGTKEQLEHLLAERFAVRTPPPEPQAPARPASLKNEDPPTIAEVVPAVRMSLPPPEIGERHEGKRHRWLFPVIFSALILAGVTIWLLIR